MRLVICPGFHDRYLTECFLAGLSEFWESSADDRPYLQMLDRALVFPAHQHPPYSAIDIFNFLCSQEQIVGAIPPRSPSSESLAFVSFSAGGVGAIGAAWMWQQFGGKVGAFFALDGWGVPLGGDFPAHRISHDRFTHLSSALLGSGGESFWADPPVAHLDLWKSPHRVTGWHISRTAEGVETAKPTTAAAFLVHLLKQYGVN
ncbi:MAG: hypothetical protein HC942_25265 [Microcoleus sp. SU_5_6]|nr:hypothetical protein [Microcoleus sp. SU_5_6]NJL66063.1 hypothetical protein [Microcoleus sp. SM1_3_4]